MAQLAIGARRRQVVRFDAFLKGSGETQIIMTLGE